MTSAVHVGSVFGILPTLPDQSVNCCVTSPPYWGLRDYGTAVWEGSGDPLCDHLEKIGGTSASTLGAASGGHDLSEEARVRSTMRSFVPYRDICPKCGAVRVDSQLGLEATPELYVERMVAVFAEVKRVLRDDGTLWLNLGDSYASSPPGNGKGFTPETTGLHGGRNSARYQETMNAGTGTKRNTVVGGLKPKDLCGIPWRVAFALQADGWYLRSDIIWAKPNPMPESVTDRPTKAHEYVFLMSKRERYWYDAEAIREPSDGRTWHDATGPGYFAPGQSPQTGTRRAKVPGGWEVDPGAHGTIHRSGRTEATYVEKKQDGHGRRYEGFNERYFGGEPPAARNRRTVWTIATQPFAEAHFATFPEKLVEPCVLAGCPEGGTVLDPFAGSGTTGVVACRLGRSFVGVELNPEYAAMAERRIAPHANQLQLEATS